jgi:hypothetical protein
MVIGVDAQDHHYTEKESEKAIEDAFRSAYVNRSEEISDFFNKTFGPGGDADDIGERFKVAWEGASSGVKRFVNETYWNISRTIQGDPVVNATMSLEDVTARISASAEHAQSRSGKSGKSKPTDKVKGDDKQEQASVLDTAWNFFKSVFGQPTKGDPPMASVPETASLAPTNTGGFTLGLLSFVAGFILLIQAGLNRNSMVNKPAAPASISEVPSGYVRIT